MEFLCDKMLGGLGRWMRIAGYDTEIIDTDIADNEILEIALREHRLLLTRDHHFLNLEAPAGSVLHLKGNSLEECVKELNQELSLDWLYRPFTRCNRCNTPLSTPTDIVVKAQAPERLRHEDYPFWTCTRCDKLYWNGSHTKRMLDQLQHFQQLGRN